MIRITCALLSVSDKRGVVAFARGLADRRVEIISTGGTARALVEAGIRVAEVSTLTGVPEMLGGRVKTLHPAVHAGILFRRGRADDEAAMSSQGFGPIDLVAVNLYPFEAAAARGAGRGEVVEEIDIGGPALLRSAAKNHEHVVAVCDPDDYERLLAELTDTGGISPETSGRLAAKVFRRTSGYDAAIAAYFDGTKPAAVTDLPAKLLINLEQLRALRYGENPHQSAAFYAAPGRGEPWTQLGGKDVSYNNLLDLDAGLALLAEFQDPTAVIIKHNNPCGAASAATVPLAVERALAGDPLSAFGGVVLVNEALDADSAHRLAEIFLEVVAAPAFEPAALEAFAKKKNLIRLQLGPYLVPSRLVRTALGGALVEEADPIGGLPLETRCVTRVEPTTAAWHDLDFAWRLCKHVRSNAIVFARDRMLLGAGAGQQSRIDSVEIALTKAARSGHEVKGSVMASDAFFPFRDSIDRAAAVGVAAIVQPGGSVRDEESIEAADEAGIAMLFTKRRAFRH